MGKAGRKKGSIPWNKGLKTGLIPKTAWKKGKLPWNTGLKGVLPPPWTTGLKAKDNPKLARVLELAHKARKGKPAWNKGLMGIMPTPWNKKTPISKICHCGKVFYVRPYRLDESKFCSRKCINQGRKQTKEHIRRSLYRRPMSSLEIRVNDTILKNNLPYKFVGNGQFFIERKNPDFINTKGKKIAIEVYCRLQKEKIRGVSVEKWKNDRSSLFAKYGWKIIFIEDYQTNNECDIINLMKGEY